jgi:glycosyltransferase involved in cell wall biosynthesis
VPRIVSVGRLHYPKDFFTLVRALAHLAPEPYFALIVGDGPDRLALARELARLGLEGTVRIAGYRDDVPDLLASADVFVLCSDSEAMPMSVLEAMAAGLPVVASSVGGIPELVVDGETGTLVPPRDERALAAALRSYVGDTRMRRRMGQAGRDRAETLFDLPRFHNAHMELYRSELARRGLPLPSAD